MNDDLLAVVRKGRGKFQKWRKEHPESLLDLSGADLAGAKLSGIDLSGANLTSANLNKAWLEGASLRSANLQQATLSGARLRDADLSLAQLQRVVADNVDFSQANLNSAKLNQSNLRSANLKNAILRDAKLIEADLSSSQLSSADLSSADLTSSILVAADLTDSYLNSCEFADAKLGRTVFIRCDLSSTVGLETVQHLAPCVVDINTLVQSHGHVPRTLLSQSGAPGWLIEASRFFESDLTPNEIGNILNTSMFPELVKRRVPLGGAFISYSRADQQIVDQLHSRLIREGFPAWLDIRDAFAEPMGRQITDTIRSRDLVILVLSQHSLQSDWVWHEIRAARKKEQADGRYTLCPITLDNAWLKPEGYGPAVQTAVEEHQVEIGYLKNNNILPFHAPHTFDTQFTKLIRGIVRQYGRPGQDDR